MTSSSASSGWNDASRDQRQAAAFEDYRKIAASAAAVGARCKQPITEASVPTRHSSNAAEPTASRVFLTRRFSPGIFEPDSRGPSQISASSSIIRASISLVEGDILNKRTRKGWMKSIDADAAHAAAAVAAAATSTSGGNAPRFCPRSIAIAAASTACERNIRRFCPQPIASAPASARRQGQDTFSVDVTGMHECQQKTDVLYDLIERFDWKRALNRCRTNPADARYFDSATHTPALHLLAYTGNAPLELLSEVLHAWPKAAHLPGRKGETPLHVRCQSSQQSVGPVEILLRHGPEAARMFDIGGRTPLHVACGSAAMLRVLELLVDAYPDALLVRDNNFGKTPFMTLWDSYLLSIPGHLKIATLLKGTTSGENNMARSDEIGGSFGRFWEKVRFLVARSHQQLLVGNSTNLQLQDPDSLFVHGLLRFPCSKGQLLRVALRVQPDLAQKKDRNGDFPIHVLLRSRPVRKDEKDAISTMVWSYPEAASILDGTGHSPLCIAIASGIMWHEGLDILAKAAPDTLGTPDMSTRLFPFMLAGHVSGERSVEATFQLLRLKPEVVLWRGAI